MMNKEDLDGKILDYISGDLHSQELFEFETQIKQDTVLSQKVEQAQHALSLLERTDHIQIPKLSQSMDEGFYQMLSQAKNQPLGIWRKTNILLEQIFQFDKLKPVLYGAAMMVIGVLVGQNHQTSNIKTEINNNYVDIAHANKMEKLAVISLLKLPSASARLQAVSLVENSNEIDDVIIDALFDTLNKDTNINVRLAALNALAAFSNTPVVRVGLVSSILHQDSPMIQVAISELMLNLQETKAIAPLQKLLDDNTTINTAKEKIADTLSQLI